MELLERIEGSGRCILRCLQKEKRDYIPDTATYHSMHPVVAVLFDWTHYSAQGFGLQQAERAKCEATCLLTQFEISR